MLRRAARRFAIILVALVGGTAVPATLLALAAGIAVLRAVSVAFYIVGAMLLTGTVIMGVRGPLRPEYHEHGAGRMFGPRLIRRATADERWTAQQSALLLFSLGIILITLGAAIDPVHRNV